MGQESSRHEVPAPHSVRVAVTEIINVAGIVGYHSSIVVGGSEYFFDNMGIISAAAFASHFAGQKRHNPMETEVLDCGRSPHSGQQMMAFLTPFFKKGSYDILYKNCNSFTDCALYFLTGARLEGCYSRMERLMTMTSPISTAVMNQLFRSYMEHTGNQCDIDVYVPNPVSQEFDAREVIACVDDFESGRESIETTCGMCHPAQSSRGQRVMPHQALPRGVRAGVLLDGRSQTFVRYS